MKKKWVRWALLGVAAALLAALLLALAPWSWEKLDIDKLTQLKQTSILYDADGERVGSLYGSEHRVYVTLDAVPLHVQQAFLAAEDQRFYEHPGVDIVRMFGALWHDIRTMSLEQGASTITQQLIKLTHLSGEKTLSRKAQEAVLALQLERQMDKDDILERYLNVVYFGRGAYGIEAAANSYFGKSAGELTLAEGALLAGVIKSPSNYAPHLEPENAVERRDLILQTMADCGYITQEEADEAQKEALELHLSEESARYGWYLDAAATEAQEKLGISRDELLTGGYAIYTALDTGAQTAAEELFENGANFPDPASDGTPAQAALVAENVENGEIVALLGGRSYGTPVISVSGGGKSFVYLRLVSSGQCHSQPFVKSGLPRQLSVFPYLSHKGVTPVKIHGVKKQHGLVSQFRIKASVSVQFKSQLVLLYFRVGVFPLG